MEKGEATKVFKFLVEMADIDMEAAFYAYMSDDCEEATRHERTRGTSTTI